MKGYEGFNIGLILNNTDSGISPSFFQFTYTESIHSILPSVELNFSDTYGLLQENLTFCEGKEFLLYIKDGREDEDDDAKFIHLVSVSEDKSFSGENDTFISTNNRVTALHYFYTNDQIKSEGYEETSSAIIRRLIDNSAYKFQGINITNSDDKKIFYQPLLNDIDFIDSILLKEAYSKSNTAYFCYIDSFDEFNYITYNDMFNSKSIGKLSDIPEDIKQIGKNQILNYNIVNLGSKRLKGHRNKNIYSFTNEGKLDFDNFEIPEFLLGKNKVLPIIKKNNANNISGFIDTLNQSYEDSEKSNINGRYIYDSKNCYFIERIHIVTTYNAKFRVGNKIELDLHLHDGEDVLLSSYYSGNWFIEVNSIVWDNIGKNLINNMILFRSNFKVPSSQFDYDNFIKE